MKGKVKWFNNKKGYGFIAAEDGTEYFVHFSEIQKEGYKTLGEDEEVTFEVSKEDGSDRVRATSVVPA